MSARVREHIRSNVYGFVAIFIALSGTAYAVNGPLPGKNQVGSVDIINGEVKNQDLAAEAVTADKLAADAVTNPKLADDAVGSAEVTPNSLGGGDVNEGSLGPVPVATLGGYGRSAHLHAFSSCSPTNDTFIDCGFTALNLPSATRVFMTGSANAYTGTIGGCRLTTSTGAIVTTEVSVQPPGNVSLSGVTPVLGPGVVDFGIECRGNPGDSDPQYTQVNVSAVALSAH